MGVGSSIRAGAAYVEIIAKDNKLSAGLRNAQAKLKAFSQSAFGLANKMRGVAAAGTAVVGFGMAAAHGFAKAGDQLDKMSQRTGFTVSTLSELGFAAEQSGASIENIEKAAAGMQRQIAAAETALAKVGNKRGLEAMSEEAKNASNALLGVGLSIEDIRGLSPEQQFEKIAEALNGIEDESMKRGAAMQIFGKSGKDILPMLANMKALRQEARDLGITLSGDDALAGAEFEDAMNRVNRVVKAGWHGIGAAIAPIITTIANTIARSGKVVIDFIRENKNLIAAIMAIAAIAPIVVAGIFGIGVAAAGAAMAMGAIASAIAFLISPVGLAVAAVAGLTAYFLICTDTGRELVDYLGARFAWLGSVFKDTFNGILSALRRGDLAAAGEIAFAGLNLVFQKGKMYLWGFWQETWDYCTDVFDSFIFGILDAANWLGTSLKQAWELIKVTALNSFESILTAVLKVEKFIAKAFWTAVDSILKSFYWVIDKIIKAGYELHLLDDSDGSLQKAQSFLDNAKSKGNNFVSNQSAKAENIFQEKIDDSTARRNANNKSYGDASTKLNDEYRREREMLERGRDAKRQERQDESAKAMEKLRNELSAAKQKFSDIQKQEAAKQTEATEAKAEKVKAVKTTTQAEMTKAKTFNLGTFDASMARFMGVGGASSIENKQLKATEETRDYTKKLYTETKKQGSESTSMTFE